MYRGLDVFNVFLRVKVFTANDFSLLKLFRELWSNLRYSYLAKNLGRKRKNENDSGLEMSVIRKSVIYLLTWLHFCIRDKWYKGNEKSICFKVTQAFYFS